MGATGQFLRVLGQEIEVNGVCFEFNRVSASGRSLPIMVGKRAGQITCNRLSERMQMTGQVECKRVVKWSAIAQQRASVVILLTWRLVVIPRSVPLVG